jgi:hypothetical protein
MFADGFHEVGAALLRGFRKGAKENAPIAVFDFGFWVLPSSSSLMREELDAE